MCGKKIDNSDIGVTDHTQLTNIGINSHAIIDAHLTSGILHRTINDSGTSTTELWSSNKTNTELTGKANTSHTHATTDITSGTFADARISSSSVTQHVGDLLHQSLNGAGTNTHGQIDTHITTVNAHIADNTKHREINDSSISSTGLYSSQKIETALTRETIGMNMRLLINTDLVGVAENQTMYYHLTNTPLASGWEAPSYDLITPGYLTSDQSFALQSDINNGFSANTNLGTTTDQHLYLWCTSNPFMFKSIMLKLSVNCSNLEEFFINGLPSYARGDDSNGLKYMQTDIISSSSYLPNYFTENVGSRIALHVRRSTDGLRLYSNVQMGGVTQSKVQNIEDVVITAPTGSDLFSYDSGTNKWINSPLVVNNGSGGDQNILSKTGLTITGKSLKAGTNITFTGTDSSQITINSSGGGGGATDLNGLSDVTISGIDYADRLVYDGFGWVNGPYNITTQGSGQTIVKTHEADTVFYSLKSSSSVGIALSGDDIVFTSSHAKITSNSIQVSDDALWKIKDSGNAIQFTWNDDIRFAIPDDLAGLAGFNPLGNYTGGFVFPAGPTSSRPSISHNMTRYNTTDSKLEYCNGTSWVQLSAGGSTESVNDRILIDNTRGQGVSVGKVLGTATGDGGAGQLQVDKRGVIWACQSGNANNTIYKWIPTDMINSPYTYTFSTIASTINTGFTGGYTCYNAVSDKFFSRYFGDVMQVIDCLTSTPSTYTLQTANNTAGMVSIGKYLYLMPWSSTKVTRIDTIAMTETVYTGIPNVISLRPCVINGYIYSYNYFGTGILKFDISTGTAVSISHGGSEQMGYLSAPVGRYIYSDVTEPPGTRIIMKFDTETETFKRITFPYDASNYGWVSGAVSDNGYIIYSTSSYNASMRLCVLNTLNDTFVYNETNAYNTIASHAYNPFSRSFMIQGSDNILRFYSCGADNREFGEISQLNNRFPSDKKVSLGGTRYIENEGGGGEDVCIKDTFDNGHIFAIRRNSTSGQSGFQAGNKCQTAFQLPVLTTTVRDALTNLNEGCIFYNTTTGTVQFYNGSSWANI